jgi:predicted ester cyclase
MTKDQYRDIYIRYIDAWNRKDLAELDAMHDELYTPDAVYHFAGDTGMQPGPAGYKAFSRMVLGENPNYYGTVEDLLVDGDKTVSRMSMKMNNADTGAVEDASAVFICRWASTQICEVWAIGPAGKW